MIAIGVKSQEVTSLLERALAQARDPEPLLRAAGTTLLSITLGNFSAHGAAHRLPPLVACFNGAAPAQARRAWTSSRLLKNRRLCLRDSADDSM